MKTKTDIATDKTKHEVIGNKSNPKQWLEFLFSAFRIDTRSLALFRILFGLILLVHLFWRSIDLVAFFTDQGVLTRSVAIEQILSPARFSVYFAGGTPIFVSILFVIQALSAFCLMIGYRTRAASIVAWTMWFSLYNRNLGIVSGADDLINTLLFWSMFLPLGIRWSVDRLLAYKKPEVPAFVQSIPSAAIITQIVVFYIFAHSAKTGVEWTRDYTAGVYAVYLESIVTDTGRLARNYIDLLKYSTFGVYWWQMIAGWAIFLPLTRGNLGYLRLFIWWGFVFMHLVFGLFLHIGLFSHICIIMLTLLLPSVFWDILDMLGKKFNPNKTITLYYDAECEVCKLGTEGVCTQQTVRKELQKFPDLLELSQKYDGIIVRDQSGTQYIGYDAMVQIFAARNFGNIIKAFLLLPIIKQSGSLCYKLLAKNRHRFNTSFAKVRTTGFRPQTPLIMQVMAGILIVLVVLQGITNHVPNFDAYSISPKMSTFLSSIGMNQQWNMFSPNPKSVAGWIVIEGKLTNGEVVDVFNERAGAPSYEQPEDLFKDYYKRDIWRKYIDERLLYSSNNQVYAMGYGKYLCRTWNKDKSNNDSEALKSFTIYKMEVRTMPNFEHSDPQKTLFWEHNCFE